MDKRQCSRLYRKESSLINEKMLEFEHRKFQNAVADNLVFEHEDTEEDKQLTVKTLEQINRGELPRGSSLFEKIKTELTDENNNGTGDLCLEDIVPDLTPVDASTPRSTRKTKPMRSQYLTFLRKLDNATYLPQRT